MRNAKCVQILVQGSYFCGNPCNNEWEETHFPFCRFMICHETIERQKDKQQGSFNGYQRLGNAAKQVTRRCVFFFFWQKWKLWLIFKMKQNKECKKLFEIRLILLLTSAAWQKKKYKSAKHQFESVVAGKAYTTELTFMQASSGFPTSFEFLPNWEKMEDKIPPIFFLSLFERKPQQKYISHTIPSYLQETQKQNKKFYSAFVTVFLESVNL